MQKIIAFAGTRQSGKSTAAKFITGYRMKQAGSLKWFDVDKDGDLLVSSAAKNDDGSVVERKGILDIYRQDEEFAAYAYEKIWPYCRIYSFANVLKQTAITVFGLNPKFIYGNNDDKNQPTHIRLLDIWLMLPFERQMDYARQHKLLPDPLPETFQLEFPPEDIMLTHREVLQDFGSICRAFNNDCWVNACIRQILMEEWPYVIIDDCRYLNEINKLKSIGAKVVLFERKPFEDNHASEQVHTYDRSLFDFVINNTDLTLEAKNNQLIELLQGCGWTELELN